MRFYDGYRFGDPGKQLETFHVGTVAGILYCSMVRVEMHEHAGEAVWLERNDDSCPSETMSGG